MHIVLSVLPVSIFIFLLFGAVSNNPALAVDIAAPSNAASFVSGVTDAKEAGTPTTTCKLGANSASNIGDLIKIDAGNYTYNRGLNFGWVLTVLNNINQIDNSAGRNQVKKLIQDFRKSGTSVIFRLCNGAECVGLGPQGASDAQMAIDGKNLGKYLTVLSYELMKDDGGGGAKTSPFWVIAGHNEPNAAEWRTPSGETAFMNALINEVSNSYTVNQNLLDLGITDDGLATKGAMPKEAFFFSIRSRINLLSPEVQDVPDGAESASALKYYNAASNAGGGGGVGCNGAKGGYFERMIQCGAIFGELDGIAANLYSVAQIKTGLEYAQSRNKKLFILESGPEDVYGKGGDAVRNSSNSFESVVAIKDSEAKNYRYTFIDQFINNPQIGAILPFNSLPLSDLTGMSGDTGKDKTFVPYTKNMYERKFQVDAENFTKLAGADTRYKSKNISGKDVKTEPVSINMGWPIFYEAQIIDMLNSAGCSNVFTRQCNYSRDNSDNNKVFTTSSNSSDTMTAYYDMVDSVKNTDPDAPLGFGGWKSDTVCVHPVVIGPCLPKDQRTAVISNMLTDAVFRSDMLTTVQVNIPLANALSNTNINGTDELNFTNYGGALKRMSYQNNVDFSRKSDATIQIALPGGQGAKTQIAFPQLGSAINLYSRDFTDKSTTDPDVLRTPKDFLNTTYQVPGSEVKPDMSPAGRRIELENNLTSLKSLQNISTPYNSGDSKLYKSSGTDDSGMTKFTIYASNIHDASGHDNGAIPTYLNYTNIKTTPDKVQFNASEILSEEAAISRAQLEQNFYVKCSNITAFDKINGAGGKPMSFQNLKDPIDTKDNAKNPDYGGNCDSNPGEGAPNVDFKVLDGSGNVVTDYSGLKDNMIPPGNAGSKYKTLHLTTISKDCYRAWCQLASNKKVADTKSEFIGGGGTNANAYASGGSQFAVSYFPVTKDYNFFSKIQTASANILSGSGMMRILRTAWEQSSRLQYKLDPSLSNQTPTTGVTTSTDTVPTSSALRVCHKNVSVQAKVYTRSYTVASKQEEYYTGNLDQCYNPNNQIQWSYKRPAVEAQGGKQYTISTSEFPWLGTVAAINERISKSDYFYKNYSGQTDTKIGGTTLSPANLAALQLKNCGLINATDPTQNSEADAMCYCAPDQKDSLAIYLCQNGWLTDPEKKQAGLTESDCVKPQTFDPVTGTFLYGSGEKSCSAYANDPKVQKVFSTLETTTGVPKEILASVWQTESSCTLPSGNDMLNGKVQDQNNVICARCNLEGMGRDPNSITAADQVDTGLTNYSACIAKNTGKSCNDAATKYNYPGVVQCCDVRGATQFEIGTWNGIIQKDEFKACRNALSSLGLDTSKTPDRAVFGDSLCASMTKFAGNNSTTVWDNAAIFRVAQSYHGGSGCLPYDVYKSRLTDTNNPMTVGEKYCGRIVDLVNSMRSPK